MLEPCSPVQGFGIRRRGVEVCGCGVVASVTFFVGVLYSVCKNLHVLSSYIKIIIIIIIIIIIMVA